MRVSECTREISAVYFVWSVLAVRTCFHSPGVSDGDAEEGHEEAEQGDERGGMHGAGCGRRDVLVL